MSKFTTQTGFTLVEALVALSIFAVIAILCYGALDRLNHTKESLVKETTRQKLIVRLISRIENDIRNAAPRPITSGAGTEHPALEASGDGSFELSRFPNPWDKRGITTIRRIGYRVEGSTLWYVIWPSLDRAPGQKPKLYPVAKDVIYFKSKFLGQENLWSSAWSDTALPQAVHLTISFNSGEEINRIFLLNALLDLVG